VGKRVSWVELYLDLVFVLAVGRLAHLIVAHPEMHSVWVALGLFATLWWTWVGFAVLYNRHGADSHALRLLILAGSVPAGVAAVAIDPASTGDSTAFALALAATRVVLASATAVAGGGTDLLRGRITRGCLVSAALFLISIWVPEPFRYVLWAIGIGLESGAMLAEDRDAARVARRDHDLTPPRRARARGRRWSRRCCWRPRCGGCTSTPWRRSTSGCSSSPAGRRRWRGRSSLSGTCSPRSRAVATTQVSGRDEEPDLARYLGGPRGR
jgi:hypothetical protein